MPLRSALSWAVLQEQSPAVDKSTGKVERVNSQATSEPPDGGYGWVVVATSFFVHLIVLGNVYSFGLFFRIYVEEFQSSHGAVAWIGGIGSGLMTGLGGLTGPWSDRFGNGKMVIMGGCLMSLGFFLASFATELWHLYFTQGLITGVGYSFAFIAGVSVVGQWFTTRRGVAVGIAVAGSGAGQFAMAFTIGALIQALKWRATLRVLALIQLTILCTAGVVLRRWLPCFTRPKTESAWKYFSDRNFVVMYIGAWIATTGLLMPFTHLAAYASQYGISTSEIVLILALAGIFSAFGRIVLGLCADKFGKLPMLIACCALGGTATLLWMLCTTFPTLLVYFVCYNFFAGGLISLVPVVAAELFGIKELSSIIGVLYTASAAGNLLAAPIGGFLYDAFKDYYAAISVSGGLMITASLVLLLIDPRRYDGKVGPFASVKEGDKIEAVPAAEKAVVVVEGKVESLLTPIAGGLDGADCSGGAVETEVAPNTQAVVEDIEQGAEELELGNQNNNNTVELFSSTNE